MAHEQLEKALALAVLDPAFREELLAKGAEGMGLRLSGRELDVLNCLLEDDGAGLKVILNLVIATSSSTMSAAPPASLQAFALATPTAASPRPHGEEASARTPTAVPPTPLFGYAVVGVQDLGRLIVARLPFGLDVIQ